MSKSAFYASKEALRKQRELEFMMVQEMTKRDFHLIAKVIQTFEPPFADRNETDVEDEEQTIQTRRALAFSFAYELIKQNPLFDREKFYKACGV